MVDCLALASYEVGLDLGEKTAETTAELTLSLLHHVSVLALVALISLQAVLRSCGLFFLCILVRFLGLEQMA